MTLIRIFFFSFAASAFTLAVQIDTPCNPKMTSQVWTVESAASKNTTISQPASSTSIGLADESGLRWYRWGNSSRSSSDMCIVASSCNPVGLETSVQLRACDTPSNCPGSIDAAWSIDMTTGFIVSGVSTQASGPLCLTLAHTSGPGINLFKCSTANSNSLWDWIPVAAAANAGKALNESEPPGITGQFRTRYPGNQPGPGKGCIASDATPGGTATIPLNATAVGRRFDGVGGLAAVGGARMLYEYPEPQQSDVLDLMFLPDRGLATHILKTEQLGDGDSSYGSGPSWQHSPDPSSRNLNSSIYLTWLIREAKKRNPEVVTYTLSWTAPGWIGEYLSSTGVKYHVDYMKAAREQFGIEFDFAGVHNEASWTRDYIKQLRTAMDAAGLNGTTIVMPDGNDKGCEDCPSSWKGKASTALAEDPGLAAAVGVLGIHGSDVEGIGDSGEWKGTYWNSEQNMVDGQMPQVEPVEQNAYGSALGWPRIFLANYVRSRATATILCPLMHSFTWGFGRQNHGLAQVVQPWSGHYELGSAFWSQGHVTALTRVGWHFLDGGGSGQLCSGETDLSTCDQLWSTFVQLENTRSSGRDASGFAPAVQNLTTVIVNTGSTSMQFQLQPVDAIMRAFLRPGMQLDTWLTLRDDKTWFLPSDPVTVAANGSVSVSVPALSVVSITTVRAVRPMQQNIPQRSPFPIPFHDSFNNQSDSQPGKYFYDLFGSFEVHTAPVDMTGQQKALRQSALLDPGSCAWHGTGDGSPITALPHGAEWRNYVVNATVFLPGNRPVSTDQGCIRVCGRVPMSQPESAAPFNASHGVCLEIWEGQSQGGSSAALPHTQGAANDDGFVWRLVETFPPSGPTENQVGLGPHGFKQTELASGLVTGASRLWNIQLELEDDTVTASINSQQVASGVESTMYLSGTPALGSNFHEAWFGSVSVSPVATSRGYTKGSFMHSIVPGVKLENNVTGQVGMLLDLTKAARDLEVSGVGRFKSTGNKEKHELDVLDSVTLDSVLPSGAALAVDMSVCESDVLGFCYGNLSEGSTVKLAAGKQYLIVSSEAAGGDYYVNVDDPAAGTTHAHRDGSCIMLYEGPGSGVVYGGALRAAGDAAFTLTNQIHGAYGPMNLLLAQS